MEDVVRQQFLLSRYGIGLDVSNRLAAFETDVFTDLAVEAEKLKAEMFKFSDTHLAE